MAFHRTVWIVAGSPRVKVDAVRHITVPATGATAVELARNLKAQKIQPVGGIRLLRAVDAQACAPEMLRADNPFQAIETYATYDELVERLKTALRQSPNAAVVMSAAVNDYEVAQVTWTDAMGAPGGLNPRDPAHPTAKLPSGLPAVRIELKPTAKIIDRIRSEWSREAYLVGFKNEPAETVVASSRKLMERAGCHLVVANSIGLTYNAILRKSG
ncbi:MAG TPA: phosphopantothenoylcysteine decarboxylase, partial [Planctomycetota bacterium]|nr:phosphopantothenoylcysteine decarboxylase [Planctomycetota bacterium]